jgi:chloramphenicol 3-O-phosphotransferase
MDISPHVSIREESLLESVIVDESLSIDFYFSIGVNTAAEEIVVIYQKGTIVSSLRLLTALRCRWVEIAPVISKLQTEVEQDKAHDEDFDACPLLISNKLIFAEPFCGNL